MRILALMTVLALVALPTQALAQEKSGSALPDHLSKFEPMLGHWKGSGTATMPGMPGPTEWHSITTVKPVLNGQWIQSEMHLSFGDAMPDMVYVAYYGWDANVEEYVTYSLRNTGEVDIPDHVSWLEDGSMLVVALTEQEGTPTVNRSVTRIEGDEQEFYWEMASGTRKFTTVVEGKSTRVDEGYEIGPADWSASYMPIPAPAPMQKLGRMAGEYVMTGEYSMAPGMPPTEISARETITPVFGGQGLRMHVQGDPIAGMEGMPNYESIGFIAWNPQAECFIEFYISNFGETSVHEMHFVGDTKLVSTSAKLTAGSPEASRGTVLLDETGSIKKAIMERMNAGNEPERAFTGTYEKQLEDAKEKESMEKGTKEKSGY